MEEVKMFLLSCPTYFLATIEDNRPRVRPFSSLCEFEGHLYIESSRFKAVYKQICLNPKVEISAFDSKDRWVRIECCLVEDNRVIAKKALLDAMPEIRELGYDENDDSMVVWYMDNAVATFYSYTTEPRILRF